MKDSLQSRQPRTAEEMWNNSIQDEESKTETHQKAILDKMDAICDLIRVWKTQDEENFLKHLLWLNEIVTAIKTNTLLREKLLDKERS